MHITTYKPLSVLYKIKNEELYAVIQFTEATAQFYNNPNWLHQVYLYINYALLYKFLMRQWHKNNRGKEGERKENKKKENKNVSGFF